LDQVDHKHTPEPSRRELLGGLAVLTILACVIMARRGTPQNSLAAPASNNPQALTGAAAIDVPAHAQLDAPAFNAALVHDHSD
jgi:hypothetical protein